MRIVFSLLLLITTAVCNTALSQEVKFYAEPATITVGKDEQFQVKFTIENAKTVEQINAPKFPNFTVIAGPIQQSSMNSVNGKVKSTVSLMYVLQPTATGTFTLGRALAFAENDKFLTEPITVKVTKKSSGTNGNKKSTSPQVSVSPFSGISWDDINADKNRQEYNDYILRRGDNVNEKIKKNLFVKLDVSRKTCHVGEPVVATYKLYSRLKSESNVLKTPSFNGFSVTELLRPEQANMTTEKYNGRDYNVYVLRKVELYPLQTGSLELAPTEVENRVTFIKDDAPHSSPHSLFDNFFGDATGGDEGGTIVKTVVLKNDPTSVNVLPLPEENKPADFKGAVGIYRMVAYIENTKFTAGEPIRLLVKVEGAGNIQMVNPPTVNFPEGIESYEGSTVENIDKTAAPMQGSKTFIYPFAASQAGTYIIPPISFSYYDVSKGTYATLLSKPIEVRVGRGAVAKSINNPVIGKDFGLGTTDVLVIGGAAALFLGLIVFYMRNGQSKKESRKEVVQQNTAASTVVAAKPEVTCHPLQKVEPYIHSGDITMFYSTLNNSLKEYLSKKLDIPFAELNRKRIFEKLDKYNVGLGTTLILGSLLDSIELSLYAPSGESGQTVTDYERANELVALLEKQIA
jgi:hypothetical protein